MRSRPIAFPAFLAPFLALVVLHAPLLRLPYYWDEAGYYIPAALDFYHAGLLIPQSTVPVGHTPLVIIYLGLVWRLCGFSPLVTRTAMLMLAAATVASLYALGRLVTSPEVAAWSAALLAVSPLFFAQSSLVHPDLAASLFTTLALLALLQRRLWIFALTASLAVLSKETAVILLPAAWVIYWRSKKSDANEASPQGNDARPPHPSHSTVHPLPGWWRWVGGEGVGWWLALATPLLPLFAWAAYYHHATGYWTGNREYLAYNLYSTLVPGRIFWALLRRLYQIFIGGFNWLLASGAVLGAWWRPAARRPRSPNHPLTRAGLWAAGQRRRLPDRAAHGPDARATALGGWWRRRQLSKSQRLTSGMKGAALAGASPGPTGVKKQLQQEFFLLAGALAAVYLALLSVVGGAILPRYLLPVFPLLILFAVIVLWRLPRKASRFVCLLVAGCFIGAWFINPPYPFPFEDNLAYADFVRLHQQAAKFLEAQRGQPRVLTAWPASDELTRPFLGYVQMPLRVVAVAGFAARDFRAVAPNSFDLLYIYSRTWEPRHNLSMRFSWWRKVQERYFDYQRQIPEEILAACYRLRLLQHFERRGQWVRIYSRR